MLPSLLLPKFSLPKFSLPTHLYLVKALLPTCGLALLLSPLPAYAGHWVMTLDGSTTVDGGDVGNYTFAKSQVTGPDPWSATNHIYFDVSDGSCALGLPGSLSVTATLTWTPDSPTDTSQPPPTVDVLETASAGGAEWMLQPTGVSTSADDGLGDPMTYATAPVYGASSSGRHRNHMTVSAGQTSVTLPTRSLSASLTYATAITTSSNNDGMGYAVQIDPYQVTLSRDGARGETQDPDGTKHGDTIYSYGDYINTEDTGLEKRTDYLNWQTFRSNLIGNWAFPQGSSPYWAWTPSESDDTIDTGKVSMHYRDYYTLEGEPRGIDDAPETRTVSYSVTDPLGATATADYILTVHDPNEVGPDSFTRGIENLRMAPNAAYGRSTVDGSPVTVYAEQSDSWSLGISADVTWVLPKLGLNASASYTYSYNAGVQCVLPNVQAGYGTYLEEFDAYKYHTGTITQWDAGGYVGTHPYHVKEPDRPSGGYQAHTPAVSLPDGGIH